MYCVLFFFFNDTATTEIYTLSLHDALPICPSDLHDRGQPRIAVAALEERDLGAVEAARRGELLLRETAAESRLPHRSEEHTSELQSRQYLVCRLLLEKKKKTQLDDYYFIQ